MLLHFDTEIKVEWTAPERNERRQKMFEAHEQNIRRTFWQNRFEIQIFGKYFRQINWIISVYEKMLKFMSQTTPFTKLNNSEKCQQKPAGFQEWAIRKKAFMTGSGHKGIVESFNNATGNLSCHKTCIIFFAILWVLLLSFCCFRLPPRAQLFKFPFKFP